MLTSMQFALDRLRVRLEKVIEAEVKSKGMTRDKIYQAYTKGTSMKKLIHPNDIADLALFLSSSKSRLVSGRSLLLMVIQRCQIQNSNL